jgi:hypothetical protein
MNPWVILGFVLAVGAAAGGGYYKGNSAGQAEVQQAWDKEKAEQYAAYAKGQEEARRREQEMQQAADKLRREKDAEIRNINARATALTNSLRDRQERPAENGTASGTAGLTDASGWCTGARLYREHAEAFAGESALAAELQSELKSCLKQYEAAKKALNHYQSSK